MSLLIIRSNKRFAVQQPVSVRAPGGPDLPGLLVEISLSGCRISNLREHAVKTGDRITVVFDGLEDMRAQVRWFGEGTAGLKLDRVLRHAALETIIGHCRSTARNSALLLYGT